MHNTYLSCLLNDEAKSIPYIVLFDLSSPQKSARNMSLDCLDKLGTNGKSL